MYPCATVIGKYKILALLLVILTLFTSSVAYAADPQEIIELRDSNTKVFDIGNGQRQVKVSMGAIHYKDETGAWQDINDNYSEPDSGDYTARFTKLPYVIRMGDDSGRRIYPDRNDLSYWIELGKPFPSMGAPTKIGGYWAWDFPNAAIGVRVEHESVKFGFRLKNSSAPTSITIPFSSQGITRQGQWLFHNGIPVGQLNRPFARDANGVERDVDIEFGVGEITLSLDTTGLTFPIDVDPTWQVGLSSDDCFRRTDPAHLYWSLTIDELSAGANSNYSVIQTGGGMRFQNVTIPQGYNIDNAYITFKAKTARNGTTVNTKISAEDVDDAAVFANSAATYDTRFANHTTARVDWDNIPAWTQELAYNSAEIKTVIQEIVDRVGWASGQDIVIFWEDYDNRSTYGANCDRSAYSYDGSSSKCPVLNVTYSEPAGEPTVTTSAATNIEDTTATGNGEITDIGGSNANTRGFEWDVDSGAPYANDVHEDGDFGVEAYALGLTSLPTGTTIYFRAYATNDDGTGYGSEETFLTKPAAPTDVAATDGVHTDKVLVTWTKSTGATNYKIYRDAGLVDTLGDVATYDDTGADAPVITPGSAVASDGSSTANVSLSISGASIANGTTHTYKIVASNNSGDSDDSDTDTGYRGSGSLNYQWYISAGDSDASYSVIEGATASTYVDDTSPAPTITPGTASASDNISPSYVTLSIAGESANAGDGRYWKVELSASDSANQTSAADRGYIGVGALTYQWQRSAADSDADYSNIDGATTDPYNDTDGVVDPDGRYYQAVLNATSAAQQTTTSDRGNKSGEPETISPPTNFTLTDLGAITIQMDWTMGANSEYTMIRVSRSDYPTTITEGELVYYGDNISDNTSGYALDVNSFFFTAWGFDSDNVTYSDNYTTATIGGEELEELVIEITAFNVLVASFNELFSEFNTLLSNGINSYILLAIAVLITTIAFWQKNSFLYIMACPINMIYGLSLANEAIVSSTEWVMGVIITVIGLFCLFRVVVNELLKRGAKQT